MAERPLFPRVRNRVERVKERVRPQARGQRLGGGRVLEQTRTRVKERVEKIKRRKPGIIPRANETFERWVPGKRIKEFLEPIRGELYTSYEDLEKRRTLPPVRSRAF